MIRLLHNPRCSKSRGALQLLEERGIPVEVVDYLSGVLTPDEILGICGKLGCSPRDVLRTKEARFQELGLSPKDERPDEAWAQILADHPILLERPIAVAGDKAAIGRPPERVLDVLP
jgi:arsenate reductase